MLYIQALVLTNCDIDWMYAFYLSFLNASDAIIFTFYVAVNSYIWPQNAMLWCAVPKFFWCVSLYFLNTDKVDYLVYCFIITLVTNLIQIILSEEIMLEVHREEVENASSYGGIACYTAINLDVKYIFKMTFINIAETVLGT